MRCNLCKGLGSHFIQQKGKEWFTCQACGGNGDRAPTGTGVIAINKKQQKFMKPEK